MNDFTFRYRFRITQRSTIQCDMSRLELGKLADGRVVLLAAADDETPLKSAQDVVLRASGWKSSEEAQSYGKKLADRLAVALVRHQIGVYPIGTVPQGVFFNSHLEMLEAQVGQRVVNDVYGLSVLPTEPPTRFARMEPRVALGISGDQLKLTFAQFASTLHILSHREKLAIDFFNISFLQDSRAVRLVSLVMAIEALLELKQRAPAGMQLVQSFMGQTRASTSLPIGERDSLLGSLHYLQLESIRHAGSTLAEQRLHGRKYHDMVPAKFFSYCYDLRSKLVHGNVPVPSDENLGIAAADLEVFVADLIVQPYVAAA